MADQRRDWDKEMAAIDHVIAKGGYVAPSGAAPVATTGGGVGAPTPAALPPPMGGRAWLGMWARTLLALGLAAGLYAWPWSRYCGLRLYWYLGAVGLLALAALWVMLVSWRRRSGLSHLLGFLILAYAVWLGASEILPRTGYAKVVRTWSCPTPPPPASSQ
ncbi:MAG: hypothetical protein ABIQ41_06060 [Gemmatimonadales bacterium]